MEYIEAHVEHLLGRRVVDVDGQRIGRLEEMLAEVVDGETVVTEFHVGGAAVVERLAAFITQLPFFRYIPFARTGYCVRWEDFDLSNPRALRLTLRRAELKRVEIGVTAGRTS